LIALVLMLSAEVATSAPAPIRRSGSGEAVFAARTESRARTIANFVESDAFLEQVVQSSQVEEHLAHLGSKAKRCARLFARLSVHHDGEQIRVRFDGPLSILCVVAFELTRDGGPEAVALRDEYQKRVRAMARLRTVGRGFVTEAE